MAFVLADRVLETSTSTGTGSFVLAGARDGYQSFTDALNNGDTTYYTITDGTDWEVGLGTWTESTVTLARTTVLSSSNSGSAVNFGAGTKEVFISYPSGKLAEDTTAALLKSGGTMTGDLVFGDDVNATFGAGSDLQIRHEAAGNNSVIRESGTGSLYIDATNLFLRSRTFENMAKLYQDGAVELYHNNSKKFETTSTGIDVTGDIRVYDDDKLRVGDGVDSFGVNHPDMDIYHDSSSGENHIEAYNGVIHIGGGSTKTGTAKLVFAGGSGAGGSVIELNSNANTVPEQRINAMQSAVDFDLQHNGSNKITLNTSGVTFHDSYTFPTSDGSANQVLQTNGSGQLSFADSATISTGVINYIDTFFNLPNDWTCVELVVANTSNTTRMGPFYVEYGITGVDTTIAFNCNRIELDASPFVDFATGSSDNNFDNMAVGGSLSRSGVFFARLTRHLSGSTHYISMESIYPDVNNAFEMIRGTRAIANSSNQNFIKVYRGSYYGTVQLQYAIKTWT